MFLLRIGSCIMSNNNINILKILCTFLVVLGHATSYELTNIDGVQWEYNRRIDIRSTL